MDKQYLTVFLRNGATLRFDQVTNIVDSSNTLTFDYVSASTGRKCHGRFDRKTFAGFSFTSD
jgi:hypothetical protein